MYQKNYIIKHSVKRVSELYNPRTLNVSEFGLPYNSVFISLFGSMRSLPLENHKKPFMYTAEKYANVDLYGSPRKKTIKAISILKTDKDTVNAYKIVPTKQKIYNIPENKLLVLNFNLLGKVHAYTGRKTKHIDAFKNKLLTVLVSTMTYSDRMAYIHIPITTPPPKYEVLKIQATKKISYVNTEFNTEFSMLILEIYKLLTPKHSMASVMSRMNRIDMKRINLVFTVGNKVSILNLYFLVSLVDEFQLPTNLRYPHTVVTKYFLVYLLKMYNIGTAQADGDANTTPTTDSELNVALRFEEKLIKDSKVQPVTRRAMIPKHQLKSDNYLDTANRAMSENLENSNIPDSQYQKHISDLKSSPFKVKPVGDINIGNIAMRDRPGVFDKTSLTDSISAYDNGYRDKLLKKDIKNMFYSVTNAGYLVTNHDIERSDSAMGSMDTHTLTIKPLGSRPTKLKYIIPNITKDGTFKNSTHDYIMRKQKADKPIRKINSSSVSLSSFYGKLFVKKHHFKSHDRGHAILRAISKLEKSGEVTLLMTGSYSVIDVLLPTMYTLFSRYIKSMSYRGFYYTFDYMDRTDIITKTTLDVLEVGGYVVMAVGKRNRYLLINAKNEVYMYDNGVRVRQDDMLEHFNIDVNKLPVEYATIKVAGDLMSIAVPLVYIYGITGLLERLGVEYDEHETKISRLGKNEYALQFSDRTIILKKNVDTKTDLILYGLAKNKHLAEIKMSSLDVKSGVFDLLDLMGSSPRQGVEFKLLDSMFVDPITKDVLVLMGEPTTFRELLIRSCEMLSTDFTKHPNEGVLIRGYDRMAGMVYKGLTATMRTFENRKGLYNNKLLANPYDTLARIQSDSTVMLVEDLNPISTLKQVEDVTMTGEFGRNKETIVGVSREFHPSEVGIFSEGSKDSGDVGVSAFLSASPTIGNLRGVLEHVDIKDLNPVNLYTTTTMLLPGNDIDDRKRANFSNIQHGHLVPINSSVVSPITTGYDHLIADRVQSKYASKSTGDGVVTKVNNKYVEIELSSGGKEKHPLKSWTSKEESNSTYTHDMTNAVSAGDKVSKGDVVTYDTSFFEMSMFDKREVVLKTSTLMYLVFLNVQETHEDSIAISNKQTSNMATTVTKIRSSVIDINTTISNLVKVGDKVGYHDRLFTIIDDTGSGSDIEGLNISADTAETLESFASSNRIKKSHVDGVVTKVVFYYNCEIDDMSSSLREPVRASDRNLDYGGRVTTGYSVNGAPLTVGSIHLKIYIAANLNFSVGDKAVVMNQLKCTVSDVFSDDMETEAGIKIDGKFSAKSKDARIVNSPEVIGMATSAMVYLAKTAVDMYFTDTKKEIK